MKIPNCFDFRSQGPSLPADFVSKVLSFPRVGIHRTPSAGEIAEAFDDVLDAIQDENRAKRRVQVAQARYNRLVTEASRG